jgi:hypothetical protein
MSKVALLGDNFCYIILFVKVSQKAKKFKGGFYP